MIGFAFTLLLGKIAAVVAWFGKLFIAVFTAAWDLLRDAFTWPVEEFMKIAASAVGSISVDSITQNVGAIPDQIANILGLLGVGTALSMIVAAIGIRMVLQLIPFTRLGS